MMSSMSFKLLVVDDSALICCALHGLLEGIPGIESVHQADTLSMTLASVARIQPTLLILDLHLPDGLATGIIPELKHNAPAMQMAVLTIDANPYQLEKCLALGVNWFFDKSTEFECLLDVVRQKAVATVGLVEQTLQ